MSEAGDSGVRPRPEQLRLPAAGPDEAQAIRVAEGALAQLAAVQRELEQDAARSPGRGGEAQR